MEEYVHTFDFPPFSISIPIASSYDFLSSLFSHLDMEHFEEDNNCISFFFLYDLQ